MSAIYDGDLQDHEGNTYRTEASPLSVAEFAEASARENIVPGETHKIIWGKICKWFSDMKAVCFSGSYKDLSNKPTIPSGAAANYAVANNDTTTAAGYVADARIVRAHGLEIDQINSDLSNIDVYVDAEGKLHYVDKDGADSVLPFKRFNEDDVHITKGNSAATIYTVPKDGKAYIIYASGKQSSYSSGYYYNSEKVGGVAGSTNGSMHSFSYGIHDVAAGDILKVSGSASILALIIVVYV